MYKKRVSTRLTVDQYRFVQAMANAKDKSVSSYLKDKIFEPKNKMTNDQFNQIMKTFTQRVDVLTMMRIESGLIQLLKSVQATGQMTSDDRSNLLSMKHDLKEVREGVNKLCRLCM